MKILMFFHSGSTNRGCEAIVRTAAALIKEKYPKAKIHLASRAPETDLDIHLLDHVFLDKDKSIKRYSLAWIISSLKIKIFNDETYAFRKIHADIVDSIPNYDVFLSIGGDNYCYGEQPGVYEIDRCKKSRQKISALGSIYWKGRFV